MTHEKSIKYKKAYTELNEILKILEKVLNLKQEMEK